MGEESNASKANFEAGAIRIMIVDDHEIFRQSLKSLLEQDSNYELLPGASTGKDALRLIKLFPPDIVLLDVEMPEMDGFETSKAISRLYPDIKIIGLTFLEGSKQIQELISCGAHGYVTKKSGIQEIKEAIAKVKNGQVHLGPNASLSVVRGYESPYVAGGQVKLTNKELRVLELICFEYSTAEIAAELNNSVSTIETHRTRLMQKIGCKNMVGLMRFALTNDIVKFDKL